MQKQKVRVMVASEYPERRELLSKIAEDEPDVVVVGQTNNGIKTTTLARSLRPDITLIDCYLPYTVGLDAVPLSRIGGLDTALTVSQELPDTRVVLLGNLDTVIGGESGWGQMAEKCLSKDTAQGSSCFMLRELYYDRVQAGTLVFASITPQEHTTRRERAIQISEGAMLYGGLSILGGLGLMLTVILAGAGAVLALAGAGTALLGLAGRLTASLWRRGSSRQKNLQAQNSTDKPPEIAPLRG